MLVIDALAEDRFHLPRDDAFLAGALADGGRAVRVLSSPESVAAIRAGHVGAVRADALPLHGSRARRWLPARVRHVARTLAAGPVAAARVVVFQSFSEPAVALFARWHPRARLILLVTNNLSGIGGGGWRPAVKRWLLRDAIGRASAVVAFTADHADRLRTLAPRSAARVRLFRYYQAGLARAVRPQEARGHRVNYVGWARPDKGLDRFLSLVEADASSVFRYGIYGLVAPSPSQAARMAALRGRLEVHDRYLTDEEYWEAISGALFLVLPYAPGYAGTLSGVFCDAIAAGTPVLASRIEPFVEYESRYGPMGRLIDFETAVWATPLLRRPAATEWALWQRALEAARADHAGVRIARAYRQLVDEMAQ